MTNVKTLPWSPPGRLPHRHGARRLAAASLSAASAVLARAARRLAQPAATRAMRLPVELEFYADAAAPEGALYLDGELVGWLPGVKRL